MGAWSPPELAAASPDLEAKLRSLFWDRTLLLWNMGPPGQVGNSCYGGQSQAPRTQRVGLTSGLFFTDPQLGTEKTSIFQQYLHTMTGGGPAGSLYCSKIWNHPYGF